MAYKFTNIKDKKIIIYKGESVKVGIENKMIYTPLFDRKIWAAYRFLTGGQLLELFAVHNTEVCAFTVNWSDKIKAGMRILYKDELYNITRVDDFEGYKKDMKLNCEKVVVWDKKDYPAVQ